MGRTKWLDGLRGIAAAIVAFDHLFMSDVWHPFISFWTDPPEGNRHLVQLPPIRILFAAQGMVTLFMVISGYAISISLLKDRNSPQFLERVSSAIVRRVFRIYLPVLVTASLAQLLFFFNLFNWKFDEGFLANLPQPWTTPWAHIKYLLNFMADSINIIAFQYRGSLNGQLWTMPFEFRGSNVVYLLIIGLSAWRARSRLNMLPIIASFFLWYGNWDIFGFIWGLWLAERAIAASLALSENLNTEFDLAEYEDGANPLSTLSRSLGLCRGKHRYSGLKLRKCSTLSRIGIALTFITGYYLLCLGLDGHLPPGYQFLSVFQPARWKDNWDISHMCWKSIGSAMLVYAIGELPCLQRPLNTRPVQYLGKISFALYLLHETIYQLWRDPLRDLVYLTLSGNEYGSSSEALGTDPFSFHVAWWTTAVLLGAVVVCAAHYYTIYVDNRCVVLAKRVDLWFSS
ncbi:acyltransferase 3 [Halenospora varia]|nr:acyltransferase 3 [Halenospora varia]